MNDTPSTLQEQFLKTFQDHLTRILAILTAISGTLAIFLPETAQKRAMIVVGVIVLAILGYRLYQIRRSFRQQPIALVDLSNAALRGLLPFEEGERLFGRDLDIMRVMPILVSTEFRYGVLSGDSGCGKTSIVRAAILPQLRKHGFIPLYIPAPTIDPRNTIKGVIKSEFPNLGREQKDAFELLNYLAKEENKKIVLIFDQLEEFFVVNADRNNRKIFAKWLSTIINDSTHINVLIVIRRDFFGELHDFYPDIVEPTPAKYCYRLHNFDHEQSKDVLIQSAMTDGTILSTSYADEIINGLKVDGVVKPAELQIVGSQIISKRILTDEEFERAGRSEGILRNFVADMVKSSPHEVVSRLILRLLCAENGITKSPTDLTFDQIYDSVKNDTVFSSDSKIDQEFVRRILDFFVQSRIIVLTKDHNYNLVHDYLAPRIFEATNDEETSTERANRLLNKYIVLSRDDEDVVLPVSIYEQVKKYASPELKKQEDAARLLKASQLKYSSDRLLNFVLGTAVAILVFLTFFVYNQAGYLSTESPGRPDAHKIVVRRGVSSFSWLPRIGDVLIEADYLIDELVEVNGNNQNPQELIRYERVNPALRNDYILKDYDRWVYQLIPNLYPKDKLVYFVRLGNQADAQQLLMGPELYTYDSEDLFYNNRTLLYPDLISPAIIDHWQALASAQDQDEQRGLQIDAIRSLMLLSATAPEKYQFEKKYIKTLYDLATSSEGYYYRSGYIRVFLEASELYPDLIDEKILDLLYQHATNDEGYPSFVDLTLQRLPTLIERAPAKTVEHYSAVFIEDYLGQIQDLDGDTLDDFTRVLASSDWPVKLEKQINSVNSESENSDAIRRITISTITTHPELFSTEWKSFLLKRFSEFSTRKIEKVLSNSERLVLDVLLVTLNQRPGLFSGHEESIVFEYAEAYVEAFPEEFNYLGASSPVYSAYVTAISKVTTTERVIRVLHDYKDKAKKASESQKGRYLTEAYAYGRIMMDVFLANPEHLDQNWADFIYSEIKERAIADYPKRTELTSFDDLIMDAYSSTFELKPELFQNTYDGDITAEIVMTIFNTFFEEEVGTFDIFHSRVLLAKAKPEVIENLQEDIIRRYKARQNELEQNPLLKKRSRFYQLTCDWEMEAALDSLTMTIWATDGLTISRDTVDFLVGEISSEKDDCSYMALSSLESIVGARADFITPDLSQEIILSAANEHEYRTGYTEFFAKVAKQRPEMLDKYGSEMLAAIYKSGEIDYDTIPSEIIEQIWPHDLASTKPPRDVYETFFNYVFLNTTIELEGDDTGYGSHSYDPGQVDIAGYLDSASEEVKNDMRASCIKALTSAAASSRRNGARLCLLLSADNPDFREELIDEIQTFDNSNHPEFKVSMARMQEMLEISEMETLVKEDPSKYMVVKNRLLYLIVNADSDISSAAEYILTRINAWYNEEAQTSDS